MKESEAYSAKAARAGKDIGKPGKNFEKIAAKAAKRYGSEERGKKVAGAILRNLRMKEDLAYLHTLEYLDQENIELESLSEEQINELLAGFRQRKVNRLEKKADQLERINKAKSRIRAAKRVSRQNSKVRKVGRAIGKALFGSSAVRPKPAASAKPRPVAKPAVKPVSSVRPKPKKLGEEQVKKESLTYSKFSQFLRNEESGYTNIGGARVKNDEKSVLQHIQKTFPNVKKVKKDPQHGWSPVFKESTEVGLEENYRVLATKGIGAERKEDIKVGHGVDYYHPKDGSKHMGKIHSMNNKGYVVKDDKTGEKHKFQYYRRMEEEVEHVGEGRASQRHPLEGHPYHKKSNAELIYIAKDAIKAAEAMKSHNPDAEGKYRDQANDSATVRHWRQQNGTPDWYRKKYGHVKEEVEQVDEMNKSGYSPGWMLKADPKLGKKVKDKITLAKLRQKAYGDPSAGKSVMAKEEVEQVDEVAKWRESDREQFPHERGEAPFPAGMRDHPDYLSKKKKTFMHPRPSKNPKDASYYRSTGDVYSSHLDDIGGGDRKIPLNRKGEPELSTDYLKDREQNLPRRKGKIVKTALKRAMLARKGMKEEVEQVEESSSDMKFIGSYVYKGGDGKDHKHAYYRKGNNMSGSVVVHIDGKEWKTFSNSKIANKSAIDHIKNMKEEVEQVDEKAPPGKKYERMVKHIKKGYEGDGLTKQEKGIAYATAWKAYNKGK